MNHIATSREELLAASLRAAAEKGMRGVNIREIARACGVSVGCVYRYFPSKAELMSAAVEKIWERIFASADVGGDAPFAELVRRLFACIRSGCAEYPDFFSLHASGFAAEEKGEGRRTMDRYLAGIREALARALAADDRVRAGVFDETFTREDLAGFVLDNLLLLGAARASSCERLILVTQKILY